MKKKILFLGESYRADAITWMKGLKEFGDFEIITWELQTPNNSKLNRFKRILEYFFSPISIQKIIREEKTSESLPKEVIQNLSNEQREKMVNNFIDQSAKDYELELEVMRVAKDLAKDRNNKVFILLPDGIGLRNFAYTNFYEIGIQNKFDITYWNSTPFNLSDLGYNEIKLNSSPHPLTNILKRVRTQIDLNLNIKKTKDKHV